MYIKVYITSHGGAHSNKIFKWAPYPCGVHPDVLLALLNVLSFNLACNSNISIQDAVKNYALVPIYPLEKRMLK